MQPIIEIRNLSKRYAIGRKAEMHGSVREAIMHGVRGAWQKISPFSKTDPESAEAHFWALKDINFEVNKGDTVGIIGSNGAGKSTLLKIVSRITDPTDGEIRVRGRMASLLEVGTGFHPELTGRENVFLNGAILGMSRAEIESKFDDIADFAGIGKFLDTPVKRYSSGMYVRLAFAIAAHLEPDVLIVDEVLAVGDIAFQKKCLGKMAEACSHARTVLFVSHNFAAVESLCNKCVVLQQGRVVFTGPSKEAIQFYLDHLPGESEASNSPTVDLTETKNRPAKYRPLLRRLELQDSTGRPLRTGVPAGGPLKAVVHFDLETPCIAFDASVAFDNLSGQRICTAHSAYEPDRVHKPGVGPHVFTCDIPSLPLIPGEYKVHVGLDISNHEVDWVEDATRLMVVRSDFYGTGILPDRGTFLVNNRWSIEAGESPFGNTQERLASVGAGNANGSSDAFVLR